MASDKGCQPREAEKSSKPAEQKVVTDSRFPRHAKAITDSHIAPLTSSGFRFPKSMRILKRYEYLRVQDGGNKLYCKKFLILYLPSQTNTSRIGIVVSKKVAKQAVIRNSIRRKLKETFRLHHANIRAPFDFVIIARKNAAECSYGDIERQIIGALRYEGLLL